MIQFQVYIHNNSIGNVTLVTGGETGISYVLDYATDVSFTNNGDGTCDITLDIRSYSNSVDWTCIRKAARWGAEIESVTYA